MNLATYRPGFVRGLTRAHGPNVKDCVAKGRANTAWGDANGSRKHPERLSRGEAHRNAKVTWEIAREVRRRFAAGEPQASIGRAFSLSTNTIHAIVHNLRWVENG